MTCHHDARELLSALLDDALAGEQRLAVQRHVDGCDECRRELERLRQTVGLLHRLPPARAPVGFVDRVLEAARPTPWHERLWRRLLLPLRVRLPLEAAALVLVAGLAVYVFERTPELQQAARQEAPGALPSEARRAEPLPPTAPPTAPVPPAGAKPESASAPPAPARTAPLAKENARAQVENRRKAEPAAPREEKSAASGALIGRESATRDRADAPTAQPGSPPAAERAEAARPGQSLAARAPAALRAAPDVAGRLVVADRAEGAEALGALAARLGAVEVSRRLEADEAVVELALPREIYPALVEGLAGIGRWTVERAPAELPARVRISIRLTG